MKLFIQHNGEQAGPFTLAEVQARLRDKALSAKTNFARCEGVEVWQPLGEVLFDIHVASAGKQQTAPTTPEPPQMLQPEAETATASSPESERPLLSGGQGLAPPPLPRARFGDKGKIHIFSEGKWMNPVFLPEVERLLSDGLLSGEDYFFIHGMKSPMPIAAFPAFAPTSIARAASSPQARVFGCRGGARLGRGLFGDAVVSDCSVGFLLRHAHGDQKRSIRQSGRCFGHFKLLHYARLIGRAFHLSHLVLEHTTPEPIRSNRWQDFSASMGRRRTNRHSDS